MFVRKFILLAILFGSIFSSCEKKDNEFQTSAVITGPDLGQCICCGGYFVEIGDSTYNFENLPTETNIELATESFPIEVNINWEYDKKCGNIQYIEITGIEKIED